jgi:hypothetical protein
METIAGMLTDITSWPMTDAHAQVSFTLTSPGITSVALVSTRTLSHSE